MARVVIDTLFYYFREGKYEPDSGYDTRDEWTTLRAMAADGLIQIVDQTVYPNSEDPKIARILANLDGLEEFIKKASPEFRKQMTVEHDIEFNPKNRKFWKKFIELR